METNSVKRPDMQLLAESIDFELRHQETTVVLETALAKARAEGIEEAAREVDAVYPDDMYHTTRKHDARALAKRIRALVGTRSGNMP